jgi:hypothetical protein
LYKNKRDLIGRSFLIKIKNTFCDFNSNDIKKWEDEILREVRFPKYICKKCIRVSNTKDLLCKPQKIKTNK